MNSANYNGIIANIQNLISQKGIKQCVVAERAGFTPQKFSNILNKRKLLRVENVKAVADAIGVDVNELLCPAIMEEKEEK